MTGVFAIWLTRDFGAESTILARGAPRGGMTVPNLS
tara:strand:+ start:443 stop:550 length:108 start_codon:yes stop_codon:yes gene_type:complete